MKLKINRKEILAILEKCKGLHNEKTALLKAYNKQISITITNFNLFYHKYMQTDIIEEGEVVIPFKLFYNFLKRTKAEIIQIQLKDKFWLKINTTSLSLNIMCSGTENFPILPITKKQKSIEIQKSDFIDILDKALIVPIKPNEKKIHCISTQFKIEKEKLSINSTHGSMLSMYNLKINQNKTKTIELMVHRAELKKIRSIMKKEKKTDNIFLVFSKQFLIVKSKTEEIYIRTLEGSYPDLSRIFPCVAESVVLKKDALVEALSQVALLESAEFKGALFSFKRDNLKLKLANPDIGEIKKELNIKYSGPEFETLLIPDQILSFLKLMKSDIIILNVTDKEHPIIITGDKDVNFIGVTMPMR